MERERIRQGQGEGQKQTSKEKVSACKLVHPSRARACCCECACLPSEVIYVPLWIYELRWTRSWVPEHCNNVWTRFGFHFTFFSAQLEGPFAKLFLFFYYYYYNWVISLAIAKGLSWTNKNWLCVRCFGLAVFCAFILCYCSTSHAVNCFCLWSF